MHYGWKFAWGNSWIIGKWERQFDPFFSQMHLEGNNETVKAFKLLGNTDFILKVWQVFDPPSQLHEMQEINDDSKTKTDYLHRLPLSYLACRICQIFDDKKKGSTGAFSGQEIIRHTWKLSCCWWIISRMACFVSTKTQKFWICVRVLLRQMIRGKEKKRRLHLFWYK